MNKDPHTIVIHYDATFPDANMTMKKLIAMHIKRGFRTVGYHWFIDRQKIPVLHEGRPENEIGAHVGGFNDRTIGICWSGGLEYETGKDVGVWNITPAQEALLIELIKNIKKRYPTIKRVVGHKDLKATQCPGLPKGGVAEWWRNVSKEPEKKIVQSTTIQAAATQLVSGAVGGVTAVSQLDGNAQIVLIAVSAVVIIAGLWIMRERIAKWKMGDQ